VCRLRFGLFAGPAPPVLTLAPALFGILVIALALSTQRWAAGWERWLRRRATRSRPRMARWWKLAADVPQALGAGVRTALSLVGKHRSAPLAALTYWVFDIGALWAAFHAFGLGGVEGGMIGAFLGFGVDGGLAVLAVLAYRTISYWLPTLPSAVAYVRLRGTVASWRTPPAIPASPQRRASDP
jgi:uncharacterized membrane protein YbhN (UPF0104 family)